MPFGEAFAGDGEAVGVDAHAVEVGFLGEGGLDVFLYALGQRRAGWGEGRCRDGGGLGVGGFELSSICWEGREAVLGNRVGG